MSLNLGKNDYGGGLQNPQRWVLDDYINNQVKLLMGDTQDAYVSSGELAPLSVLNTQPHVTLSFKRTRIESHC